MLKLCYPCFRPSMNRMLLRSLLGNAFAVIGLFFGVVPELSGRSNILNFGSAVYAQDVTDAEVTNYARAVLKMEPARLGAYDEIKKIIGSNNVPSIACNNLDSVNALPENARTIAVDYCKQYQKIVETYLGPGSVGRFNQITANLQNDPNLKKRIQGELLRLQNNSGQ